MRRSFIGAADDLAHEREFSESVFLVDSQIGLLHIFLVASSRRLHPASASACVLVALVSGIAMGLCDSLVEFKAVDQDHVGGI